MELEAIPDFIVNKGLSEGATDVAAMVIESDRVMIRFANNDISISKSYRENIASIFLMIKNHRAHTVINELSEESVNKAIKNTIKTAKLIPPADIYAPLPSGPFEYDAQLLKPTVLKLEPENLVGYVEEAVNGAFEYKIQKVAGSLIASNSKVYLATSGNVHAEQTASQLEISIRAFASEVASGHSVSIAQDTRGFQPKEAGREAGEIAYMASNPIKGEAGRYDAVLGPLVFADLVNQVGILSSAFYIDTGQSFLIDKLGSKVASEMFTLLDDPTVVGSYGARAFDDEGLPTKRNVIVENGVLKTYLHNSLTAKKFNVNSTSNAGYIVPTPWNLIVKPGDSSVQDLISQVDDGIYVTNVWYLRYQNYRTGDFSTIPRDGLFLIKHGEISKSIRELRISDNLLRIFQNLAGLSRESKWVKWWEVEVPTYTPYALVKDLSFTKSTL